MLIYAPECFTIPMPMLPFQRCFRTSQGLWIPKRFAAGPPQACGCGPRNKTNDRPNEAGHGAERLTTPNAQGLYHRQLLGPCFQQGWMAGAVDGQMRGL